MSIVIDYTQLWNSLTVCRKCSLLLAIRMSSPCMSEGKGQRVSRRCECADLQRVFSRIHLICDHVLFVCSAHKHAFPPGIMCCTNTCNWVLGHLAQLLLVKVLLQACLATKDYHIGLQGDCSLLVHKENLTSQGIYCRLRLLFDTGSALLDAASTTVPDRQCAAHMPLGTIMQPGCKQQLSGHCATSLCTTGIQR